MFISACLITKNEENNVARCLESYKDIVSEIILVDTGSTDRTVEIAKQFGAKVYYYDWHNDFAAAKNFAIDKAKGKWIIFLDADEYFDSKSKAILPRILKKIDTNKYNAIGCKMINIDTDMNNRIIDSFMTVRIFKNDKNIRYRSNVHEGLYNKTGGIHVLALYDEIILYHTGYSSSIIKRKAERNLKILLDNIEKNGQNPQYYHYLSDCYRSLDDYENAIKYARLHIESGIKPKGYEGKVFKNIIDSLHLKQAPKNEVEEAIKDAIRRFPSHPNFYYLYGFFLYDEKRYEEALQCLLITEKLNEEYRGIEVNFAAGMLKEIYLKIGCLFELKNQEVQAFNYYFKSLQKDKRNSRAFRALFRLIQYEKTEDVVSLLNTIYDPESERDIEFIIDELKRKKAGEIFAYYVNIWRGRFAREDNSLAFLLLAMDRYESAFTIFYKGAVSNLEDTANGIFAAVAAIGADRLELFDKLTEVVSPSMKRVLLRYRGENVTLFEADWEIYCALLYEILLLKNTVILERYINLIEDLSPEVTLKVAEVLKDYNMHNQAIALYTKYLQISGVLDDRKGVAYAGLGYCFYKLHNYCEAYNTFRNAVECGYNSNDVHEYLKWIEKENPNI